MQQSDRVAQAIDRAKRRAGEAYETGFKQTGRGRHFDTADVVAIVENAVREVLSDLLPPAPARELERERDDLRERLFIAETMLEAFRNQALKTVADIDARLAGAKLHNRTNHSTKDSP